jgi:hypothetical protein
MKKKEVEGLPHLGFGSAIVTAEVAKMAFELTRPLIKRLMETGIAKRDHFHLVLLDPAITMPMGYSFKDLMSEEFIGMGMEDLILYEESFGNKEEWEHPYDMIARSKAIISLRTHMSSLYVSQMAPFLLVPGDTRYGGSTYLNGIVSGGSGFESHLDLMVTDHVAATTRALAIDTAQFISVDTPNRDFM